MLVRIDDDAVDIADGRERRARDAVCRVIRNECEEATIGSVDVHPCSMCPGEFDDLRKRIEGS